MESLYSSGGVRNLEASTAAWNFQIAVYFAFGFFFLRLFLDRFVFQRIAVWLLSTASSAPIKMKDASTRAKLVKCKESLWKLLFYGACDIFVLKVLFHEPWATDVKLYFHGWPNQELKLPIKLYYMCQCGFYMYAVAALLAWETRRKDFSVMMSHHVVTIILLVYSYLTGFFRIGAIIIALHDASDVFMETAKICKYSEKEFGASVGFSLFALSWLLLRLIYFPFWIIRATSIELLDHVDMTSAEGTIMYYSFNTLLLTLLVFHIYWWYLICAMIARLLKNRGQVGEDIRSGTIQRMMNRLCKHDRYGTCFHFSNQNPFAADVFVLSISTFTD
ncbi:hypothetical protein IGI04_020094 [Brassica rapa subsp. trilocularis]|uniref:TLC domain-containing protein n=1 Tax=Brassica rapa subsp. trilocularis TaxID=1813537 RepID=A0ABQ7MHQ8_BRACM|nr:hypothetical protein IGI04_020094 [Brassica rapa subsp. trilocularis]